MQKHLGLVFLVLLAPGAMPSPSPGVEPTDAWTIRLVHPDEQLERLIALFRGTRAPHPAAALAAWKRAAGDHHGPGKGSEALIAALNPAMVRELRNLDQARAGIGLDPRDGHLRWYVVAPRDDGSFTALATALILTDGGQDPPLEGVAVDRVGPPGSPVTARSPGVLTLAGARDDLRTALEPIPAAPAVGPGSGIVFRLEPRALAVAGNVSRRRLAEAVRASGLVTLEGNASLEGQTLAMVCDGVRASPGSAPALDPRWLDCVPASATLAAAAITLDPSSQAWDTAFAWADRVEKADPARAEVAPLRTRVNVLALAARVKPEVDLWPHLRGITACLLADDRGVLIALHTASDDAASRIAVEVLPRLASSFARGQGPLENDQPGPIRRLAIVSKRPLEVARRGATVLVGWGDSAVTVGLAALDDPSRSEGRAIRSGWLDQPLHRAGAFWPGRAGDPRLADAPPVLWSGWNDGKATHDRIVANGLHGVVRRFLERIPLDPSAERP